MNRTLRRTTLGVIALTGLPVLKAAWTTPTVPKSSQNQSSNQTESGVSIASQIMHQTVITVLGNTDTVSAITPCTGGYTGPGCTTPTPTPPPRTATPTPPPRTATPTPPPRTATPTPVNNGGGTGGGGLGNGGGGSANCDTTDLSISSGASCAQANGTSTNLFGEGGIFQTIANTLVFLVGAISVIFLIIGGLRYVISQGDKSGVEQAKNTILYAAIGIVVSVVSFAIVSFLLTALSKSG